MRVRPKVKRESKCMTCTEVESRSSICIRKTPDVGSGGGSGSDRPATSTANEHQVCFGLDPAGCGALRILGTDASLCPDTPLPLLLTPVRSRGFSSHTR